MLSTAAIPHPLPGILLDIRLALEVIAAAFAIRAYRHHRTYALRMLRYGFVCLAAAHLAVLLFSGISFYAYPHLREFRWVYYADPIGVFAFLGFSILSFRSILREPARNGTQKV